eukprot:CAMPEP_0194275518 /NCGR_PEP_ID=MMETSP0169-20130528/8340_1 /TAXON_ID=218684 /ORGANISM="Corethron pennatum, Strain L29A3" /LENGTH=106 /DNA_ID=CAMNT_0039019001 /DNA_START=168 /DNA_END=485 /DNA_ORIENTATION=+
MAPLRIQVLQKDDSAIPKKSKKDGAEEHPRPVSYTDPSPSGIDSDPSQSPPIAVALAVFHFAIRYPFTDGDGYTTVSLGDYIQKKRNQEAPKLGEVLCLIRRDQEE